MKNAVQGILGSFVSRNNDVDGYWGIGKLYRSATVAGFNSVRIDLIERKMLPHLDGFHGMIEKYENLLGKQFPDRHHYSTWLVSAEITIQFESDADQSSIPKWCDSGKPFTCVVSMENEVGAECSVTFYGRCRKHNPFMERRSNRPGG